MIHIGYVDLLQEDENPEKSTITDFCEKIGSEVIKLKEVMDKLNENLHQV